ncbi:SGNH/GDSL hydrolase family protein [Roseivirga seohaensis]|uniref:SGNH/GDSL hydrolase family protein n=1 Tax=Roseivirga seohaensis TaxID=1914963 RepID=UPI003BAC9D8C
MKNLKLYLFALLASGAIMTSCDEEENLVEQRKSDNPLPVVTDPSGSNGTVTLTKYVSIGNSITAGYMDGALYTNGQAHSFANMLGTQFQISGVGGTTFNQPDINSVNGYSGIGSNNSILGRYVLDLSIPGPRPLTGEVPTAYAGNKAELNNFAVPGMRIVDINSPALAGSNPLYARFASTPGTSTVLSDALAASPTFYTYWLGNNDALGYAVGGGVNAAMITSQADFQNALASSLSQLAGTGAKGIVMTLPPLVVLPYFRAVKWNAIPLDQATADQLNTAFAGLNAALNGLAAYNLISSAEAAKRKVTYQAGPNAILMHDKDLEDLGPKFDALVGAQAITAAQRQALEPYRQSRPATSSDLPVLSAATVLGTGTAPIGLAIPIEDKYILSANEVVKTVTARATFNQTIKGVVDQINAGAGATVITLVDVQPKFADLFGLDAATVDQLALGLGTQSSIAAVKAEADGQIVNGVNIGLGIKVNGTNLAPDFSPNGVFSTDGIHPNPRGHAIIANLILSAMRTAYGVDIPDVDVLAQRGILVQ